MLIFSSNGLDYKSRLEISMGRTRFFLLDSSHPSSLTLRDYSKVVGGHKLSLSNQKSTLSRMSGDPMLTLRPRSSKRCFYTAQLKTVCLALVVCLSLTSLVPAQGTGGRI